MIDLFETARERLPARAPGCDGPVGAIQRPIVGMNYPLRHRILLLAFVLLLAGPAMAARVPRRSDTGGVLHYLSIASFPGSGQNSIQAMATDAIGNVYVAGITSSPDLPVRNAAQPNFGESRILVTTDLGVTWNRASAPPDARLIIPDPIAPQILFASGNTGIYKSTDSGGTWRQVYQAQNTSALAIDPGNHLRVAALTPTTLVRSLDGGETWTPGGSPCPISNCAGGQQLLADPTGSGALLLTSFGVSLSRDWGQTFHHLSPPGFGSPSAAAFDPSHAGWIYVDTSAGVLGSLFLTTDYGATWMPKASPPTTFSGILHLAVAPDQSSTLVAATPDGFYQSSDGAASWIRQAGPGDSFRPEGFYPFVLLNQRCSPTGGLFALGSGPGYYQVAFSPDDGASWNRPQLSHVTSVTAGPECAVYVTRQPTTDAFVAKLTADGSVLWATYLGGSDQDAPVALAVDTQGNAYVTGNTTSPDFPSTVPHIGAPGLSSVFVTKLSSDGQLAYSVLIGGEASNTASAIAVDGRQNVFVAGHTSSHTFPITSGVLDSKLESGSYTGFLAKLSSNATLISATYLGPSYTFPEAIAVNGNDEPVIAGSGAIPGLPAPPMGSAPAFLMKLDSSLSRVLSSTYLAGGTGGGPSALAIDRQGNLLISAPAFRTGLQTTPGAYVSPIPGSGCAAATGYPGISAYDVFITKIAAADWKPVFTALLSAPCGIGVGAMVLDSAGAPVLALTSGGGFPLRNPLLAGPACSLNSSLIAKLSPDGSALDFATYLDGCGVPGIALGEDGSVYAGVSAQRSGVPAAVLRLPTTRKPSVGLEQISNAFSGDASAVVAGGLYSLALTGLPLAAIDLALNPSRDLPLELGGVQVKFDGIPAPILQTGPGRVIVAAPENLHVRSGSGAFTNVQVISNGVSSDMVWMPLSAVLPGLLTRDFPDLLPHADFADGNVRNQDGTLNDADHPAPLGSTITAFVTGMGATAPPVSSGSIASSANVVPLQRVFASWKTASPTNFPPPESVSSVPGFVSALFQIQIRVPDSIQFLGGTALPNGVQRVRLGLKLGLTFSTTVPVASNLAGIYVR